MVNKSNIVSKVIVKGLKDSPVQQRFPDLPSALLSTISIQKSKADTLPSSTACSKAQVQMEGQENIATR